MEDDFIEKLGFDMCLWGKKKKTGTIPMSSEEKMSTEMGDNGMSNTG